jgi:hypothetical protein
MSTDDVMWGHLERQLRNPFLAASDQSSLGVVGDLAVVGRSVAREDQFRIERTKNIEACSGLSRVGVERFRLQTFKRYAQVCTLCMLTFPGHHFV